MIHNILLSKIENTLHDKQLTYLYDSLEDAVENLFDICHLKSISESFDASFITKLLIKNNVICNEEEASDLVMSMESFVDSLKGMVSKVIDGIVSIGKKILGVFGSKSDDYVSSTSSDKVTEIVHDKTKTTKLPTFEHHGQILQGFNKLLEFYLKAANKIKATSNMDGPLDGVFSETSGQLFEFGKIQYEEGSDIEQELANASEEKRKAALAAAKTGRVEISWSRDAKHYFAQVGLNPSDEATYKIKKVSLFGKMLGKKNPDSEGEEDFSMDFKSTVWEGLTEITAAESGYDTKETCMKALDNLQKTYKLYKQAAETDIITSKLRALEKSLDQYHEVDKHQMSGHKPFEEKARLLSLLSIRIARVYDMSFRVLIRHFFSYYTTFHNNFKQLFTTETEEKKEN